MSNTWYTPPHIIDALTDSIEEPFDLDPCTTLQRPFDTATTHYTKYEDGLSQPWFGDVWLNPPYGRAINQWIRLLSEHGKGVALVPPRTETQWFQQYVWPKAWSILFLRGRLNFMNENLELSRSSHSTAPSILIAYGYKSHGRLVHSGLPGKLVCL